MKTWLIEIMFNEDYKIILWEHTTMERLAYFTGGMEGRLDPVWTHKVIAPQYVTQNLARFSANLEISILSISSAPCQYTYERKFYVANKFQKMLPDLSLSWLA